MNIARPLAAAILVLLAVAGVPAAEAPEPLDLPRQWVATDVKPETTRFAAMAAEFPSTLLAEGVATTLRNMGWMPVRVETAGEVSRVLVGDFASPSDAVFLAEELRLQKLADAKPARVPASMEPAGIEIDGPFLSPFLDRGVPGRPALTLATALPPVEAVVEGIAIPEERQPFVKLLEHVRTGTGADIRGSAAADLVAFLVREKREADSALFLATKVATGEWHASDSARLECAEVVADLQMEHRRDWRGAWSATRSLLAESSRKDAARGRDLLRRGALEVELAAGAGDIKPTFAGARATLRQAWDATPKTERRQLAAVELVYLKTFGMEGDWASVELLATEFASRHTRTAIGETLSARIWLARSLERREAWREAIAQLERAAATSLYPEERLYTGFEPYDVQTEAAKLRLKFLEIMAAPPEPTAEEPVAAKQP